MLHPVAGEDDAAVVVEAHGTTDDERPLGISQALGDVRVDVCVRHGLIELRHRGAKERRVPLEGRMSTGFVDARHWRASLLGTRTRSPTVAPNAACNSCVCCVEP